MVPGINSELKAQFAEKIAARMATKGLKPENLRLTLAWIPVSLDNKDPANPKKLAADPKNISKQLVVRAQWHQVKSSMYFWAKKLQYCLGFDPATNEFALPHVTAAQVKAAPNQSAAVSLDKFVEFIDKLNEEPAALPDMLITNIEAKGTWDVPANAASYTPIEAFITRWYDDNVSKNPLAPSLKSIGQALKALGLIDLVVNGLGEDGAKSRPHFTNWREELEAYLATPEVQSILAEQTRENFGLIPVIAISDESGMLFLDNLLAVKKNGQWLAPEQAKELILRPEEAPMPTYKRVAAYHASKTMLTSYPAFAAGTAAGWGATVAMQLLAQTAVQTALVSSPSAECKMQ